ncbi:MAG TPA: ATP-grasp domain-containing protein [Vicinamibacterales bacterium]|nr:ATP-grasp domain-containing protein [Vicinamibacterales bacterium]
MNVLLTCAGRRNYMVEFFRAALEGRGRVYAADCSRDAPALHEADRAFVVPPIGHAEYIEHLLELCRANEVGLLVPLNDLELPVLARHRERFRAERTVAVVSSPEVIDACFDKWVTARFLASCGVACPRTYLTLRDARTALDRGEIALPLVIKPRWGSASVGIVHVERADDLAPAYQLVRRQLAGSILAEASGRDPERAVLIQERLLGQEYGLDVVNDLDGRHLATFARLKLVMRAGETDRAVTVESDEFDRVGATIGRRLGHAGNLDCDVFLAADRLYVLELNPRFGGGYPFSHLAGANLPAALIAWASGETPDPSWLRVRPGVTAAKCDRVVIAPTLAPESPGPHDLAP